jgi:hypothetical protein
MTRNVTERLTARLIDRSHNSRMLQILSASPIEAKALTICFDRQPDMFAMAELKYDPARYVGFWSGDDLVGFIMLGFHRGYVDGQPTTVMHLSDYYVLPAFRGRGSFAEAVELLVADRPDDATLGYAVIMQGNRSAERFMALEPDRLPIAAKNRTVATLEAHSILITFRRRARRGPAVRPATVDDVEAIVALLRAEYSHRLFAPIVDRDTFVRNLGRRPGCGIESYYVAEQGGRPVGVLAAWDTRAFKQNRVVRYGTGLAMTRLAYGAVRPLFGFPRLPAPGEAFRDLHITDCAAIDRSPDVVQALLERVYADGRERGYNTIIFGSAAQDPLLAAARRFHSEVTRSHIVLFSVPPDGVGRSAPRGFLSEKPLPPLGCSAVAADFATGLDTSLPYIDVALL